MAITTSVDYVLREIAKMGSSYINIRNGRGNKTVPTPSWSVYDDYINNLVKRYPDKSIWVWTGYLFDQYLIDKEVTNYLDVVVDGQYVDELHDFRLKWKGSSNQRVIDVKKSKQAHKVILFEEKDLVGV